MCGCQYLQFGILLVVAFATSEQASTCQSLGLWPYPAQCSVTNYGRSLVVPSTMAVQANVHTTAWSRALSRFRSHAWNQVIHHQRGVIEPHLIKTDIPAVIQGKLEGSLVGLTVTVANPTETTKTLTTDESYLLNITSAGVATLTSKTIFGAMYGLDTLAQLIVYNETSLKHTIPSSPISIADAPRFPWRGLLVDTANHFIGLPTLMQVIDGMAAAKLNVFHWHMIDSYSFPFISKEHPEFAEHGAWDQAATYTAKDIETVREYAQDRGIMVVTELDVPGHAYSWGLAYPNITVSCPKINNSDIGAINDVPLNPIHPQTMPFVKALMGELVELFPGEVFHLGGDELQYDCWTHNPEISKWISDHNTTAIGLQAWFEQKVLTEALPLTRRPVVWEETFAAISHVLRNTTIVEVWNDASILNAALQQGFDALLADGWYLDRQNPVDVDDDDNWFWMDTWAQMYSVEPDSLVKPGASGHVLGGEANMWSEQVSDLDVFARVFPRAFGVAERLWSSKDVTDAGLAAQRLAKYRCQLAYRGLPFGPIWADYCGADLQATSGNSGSKGNVSKPELIASVWLSLVAGTILAIVCLVCFMGYRRASDSSNLSSVLQAPEPSVQDNTQADSAPLIAPLAPAKRERFRSLDVFRGFTIALMIFVDDAGGDFPEIDHCPWDGTRLADFVMPFFDFIVGISLALSFKKFELEGSSAKKWPAFKKATVRFLKLFILGVLTQGGVSFLQYDLSRIRIMGILQRVALCYYVVALMEIYLPRNRAVTVTNDMRGFRLFGRTLRRYGWHWCIGLILFATHTGIMYGVDVPPAYGEPCGRGVLTPPCNAATYIDKYLFTVPHMYFPSNGGGDGPDVTFQRLPECSSCSPGKCRPPPNAPEWCSNGPFDPEGIVSSFNAILATVFGVHYGHVLFLVRSPRERLVQWLPFSVLQVVVGVAAHFVLIPMNTDLYSISYVLVSNGAGGVLLSFCYWLVDIRKIGAMFWRPFMYLGMNAIVMYLFAEGDILDTFISYFYINGDEDQNLSNILWPTGVYWGLDDDIDDRTEASHDVKVLLWVFGYIGITMIVAWMMFKRRIFVKI